MKRLVIVILSFILIISAAACSRKQSQGEQKAPTEKPQINQVESSNQKSTEITVKDKKATLEQTEKVNTELTNLSNEIEKTLDSLDDIDASKLSF